ncbi:MAG: CAP domain-containing protein [Myxococcales bacterium]|nr:CAP domain-containing protein [Myxococcales bacterium]
MGSIYSCANDDVSSQDNGSQDPLTDVVQDDSGITPDSSDHTTSDTFATDALPSSNPWSKDAVTRVNFYRNLAGLSPVAEDPVLSAACQKHAEYMALHRVLTHDENPELPGYSEEGAFAGKFSNIAYGYSTITLAIDKWIEGIYHRLPLFEPGLSTIGVGMAQNYWCLDVISGAEFYLQHEPIAYPADGQVDVPVLFDGTESPNPLPESLSAPTGYFVSLQFDHDTELGENFKMLLYQNGILVESFVRYPNDVSDPNSLLQRVTVSLTALKPLRNGTTYEVVARGIVDGNPYEKIWTFNTKAAPQH